jgi:beta-glucanase (GH16 family)
LENAHCQDGHLVIEARKEDFEGRQYTSAKLKSKQSFLYGQLQVTKILKT